MRRMIVLLMAVSFFQVASSAWGQVAVQQPVISTTGVSTTVSVPDRGSVFLGGVSSAQSGRIQNGPIPSVTARGFSRQATSISTSVYIHDLQAMDEAILNSPTAASNSRRQTMFIPRSKPSAPAAAVKPPVDTAAKAARFEQLAINAEAAGKPKVARLHWQVAAKYGSKQAESRLAQK